MPVDIVEMFWRCTHCQKTNLGRHKVCSDDVHGIGCLKPKEDACEEWLPDDVSHTSSYVISRNVEPELHDNFAAGADVPCPYCRSLQWMVNGTCTNCTAPMDKGAHELEALRKEASVEREDVPIHSITKVAAPPQKQVYDTDPRQEDAFLRDVKRSSRGSWIMAGSLAGVVLASGAVYLSCRTVERPATVTATSWQYVVLVYRDTVIHENGWNAPADAIDIVDQGTRFHHNQDVLDHYETEHYTVREKCGQPTCVNVPRVCTKIPESCHITARSCRSNKNGSATCSGGDRVCSGGGQSCSGGGQSCTDQYCDADKTRQRPVYRQEPVYQHYYEWNVHRWIHNRDVPSTGDDVTPVLPSSDLVALGNNERSVSTLTCAVTFVTDDKDHNQYVYKPTDCMSELKLLPRETKRTLLVNALGSISIKPAQ